ncbi:hypothetical protein N0V84_007874 [Fusarium piperis]|uniref:Myb-like domain-containing protein n=1 Tax=Fusarium piperis TaxID=1435070 RepID=A0A9W8W9A5_9HYPO|nr:hypothetical protein N0V84_007874 [Fusarium piperis]
MNSKNWNDRADKDLFFTILSVKNIGVISGAEWTTIGNHMRGLGYGFTNEGCRQHFQGLRRAQNKAESNGGLENSRKVDPTLNPITRRPGPGRGRPRKQPPAPVTGVPGEGIPNQMMGLVAPGPHNAQPVQAYGVPPDQAILPQPMPATAAGPGPVPAPAPTATAVPGPPAPIAAGPPAGQLVSHAAYPSPPRAPELPQNPPHLHPLQHGPQNQEPRQEPLQDLREGTNTSSTSQPPTAELNHQPPSESMGPSEHLEEVSEDVDADADADVVGPIVDVDADGDADIDADADEDEPAAKRPRLSSPDPSKEVMDDEAVLALAAHSGPADPFPSDFATYGEA